MSEESSMQLNLTTNSNNDEKKKKRKVDVDEEEEGEVAKSPEKKKSRRIHNGKDTMFELQLFLTLITLYSTNSHIFWFICILDWSKSIELESRI